RTRSATRIGYPRRSIDHWRSGWAIIGSPFLPSTRWAALAGLVAGSMNRGLEGSSSVRVRRSGPRLDPLDCVAVASLPQERVERVEREWRGQREPGATPRPQGRVVAGERREVARIGAGIHPDEAAPWRAPE